MRQTLNERTNVMWHCAIAACDLVAAIAALLPADLAHIMINPLSVYI